MMDYTNPFPFPYKMIILGSKGGSKKKWTMQFKMV